MLGVKGSARQGSVVDKVPTHLQNCPINGGVISTPLPIKIISLASPSRHLGSNKKGGCEERTLMPSQTEQAWVELLVSALVTLAQPASGECSLKYK